MRKINYVRGYTIPNAKLLMKWVFPSEFYDIKANNENFTFDVYLKKPKTEEQLTELKEVISDFSEFWSKQYKFFLIDTE